MIDHETFERSQQEILVVDDTPASLQLLTGILTGHGYRVRPASDGPLALRSAALAAPDLILLDVKMPRMDGYTVCRRLKADKRTKKVPVIFISALGETTEKVEGFEAGGVDYITKPFEPEEVLARVGTHLHLRELTDHLEQKVRERTAELTEANQQLQEEILERKLAEEALRESEQKLANIIDFFPDATLVVNQRGEVIAWNKAIEEMTGIRAQEILGKGNQEYAIPFYGKKRPLLVDLVLRPEEKIHEKYEHIDRQGRILIGEAYVSHLKGKEHYLTATCAPLYDSKGNIAGGIQSIRDITERKRAETALAESRSRLSSILRSMSMDDMVFVFDREGRFSECYAPEDKLYVPVDRFIGKTLSEVLPPEFNRRFMETFNKTKQGAVDEFEYSLKIHGKIECYSAKFSPIFIADEFAGSVAVVRETTRRRQAENDLRKLNQELEQRIYERTAQLETLNQELRQARDVAEHATRAKSLFLANMSHEIRTPLNAISGFTALALRTTLTELQRDYLNKIQKASLALLEILGDILDFSKIEAGKLDVEKRTFHLDDILDDLADLFARQAAEKSIELIISVDRDVPRALIGDPSRIGQVLANLTSNAVKFTHAGEIFIHVTCTEEKENWTTLSFRVKDTGIGISEKNLQDIFLAFSQVDESLTRKYKGTGLGLAICSQLAAMMGGEIQVESKPGRGSIFTFTIPLEKKGGEAGLPYELTAQIRDLKVLVVDGNSTCRQVSKEMLESFGCQVRPAAAAEDALQLLMDAADTGAPFQLMMIDWKMPRLDALEVSIKIRGNARLATLPIIMTAGFPGDWEIDRAIDSGINAFLTKPIKQSVLFDTLMQVLGRGSDDKGSDQRLLAAKESLPAFDLKGVRVLVAEDNEINQEVVLSLLKGEGVIADLVSNGQEAVEAVKTTSYDIVLMDVQMPVMDGPEATRRVRMMESQRCKAKGPSPGIPIIAMTAHAMCGDREKCLDAGMDDYVSKPINPDLLFAVLEKWAGRRQKEKGERPDDGGQKGSVAVSYAPRFQSGVPRSLSYLPGLDVSEALRRIRGDTRLFKKLLHNFALKYAGIGGEIKDAFIAGDISRLQQLAHTLKGVSGNLSAVRLQKAARDLETALKKTDMIRPAGLETKLRNVEDALNQVLESVRSLEKSGDDDPAALAGTTEEERSLSVDDIGFLLAELNRSLAAGNIEAEELLESVVKHLHPWNVEAEIRQLKGQVNVFEFGGAQKTLKRIADLVGISL